MGPSPLLSTRAVILSAASLVAIGCGSIGGGSGQTGSEPKEADHILQASAIVSQYATAAKKQPTKMEEVRDWAVKEGKATAEDLASTRDHELYVIDMTGQGISLREQTGKNGKVYLMRMGHAGEIPLDAVERRLGDNKQIKKQMKK